MKMGRILHAPPANAVFVFLGSDFRITPIPVLLPRHLMHIIHTYMHIHIHIHIHINIHIHIYIYIYMYI